eukprot:PhM_4_TR4807/c0_g1_i1/m.26231
MMSMFKRTTKEEIAEREAAALDTFRRATADLAEKYTCETEPFDDAYLTRWLVARKWDISKAEYMIREHFKWRDACNIGTITDENFPDDLPKVYPCGFFGHDCNNNPVWCEAPGKADPASMMSTYSLELLVRWHIAIMETGKRESVRSGGRGVTVVMNTGGVSLAFRQAVPFVKAIGKIDSDNYPEHLDQLFVINTSAVVRGLWEVVKVFLDERTRNKVRLLGDKNAYAKVLEGHGINLDNVPELYGGTGANISEDGRALKQEVVDAAGSPESLPVIMTRIGQLDATKAIKSWAPQDKPQC